MVTYAIAKKNLSFYSADGYSAVKILFCRQVFYGIAKKNLNFFKTHNQNLLDPL